MIRPVALDPQGVRQNACNSRLYRDRPSDLGAFRGLDGLEVAVRVAIVSTEGPDELGRAADLAVGSTDDLLDLLRQL